MGQAAAALAHTVGDPCCEQENDDFVASIPIRGQLEESDAISTNVGDVFSVTLTRTGHMKLGLDLDFVPTREAIPVRAITGALAEEWNREHQDAQVLPGDRIVEVNGTRGVAELMMKALKESEEVRITLVRLKTSKGTDDWEYLRTYHDRLEFEENMPDAIYELVPYQGDQVNVAAAGFGEAVTGQLKSTATVIPWGGQVGGAVSVIPTGSWDGRNPDFPEPEPRTTVAVIQDPRSSNGREVGVVGFHYPGHEEAWDKLCRAGFLGGFYHLGDEDMLLETPCEPGAKRPFKTAEAAFQALKFWSVAEQFAGLSGEEAVQKSQQLGGQADFTYAGFGSAWKGMLAVLNAKFRPASPWAAGLLKTRDALLLDRASSAAGRADAPEDNNWVGLQLMLIRDQLSGESRWTEYIANMVDLETGEAHAAAASLQWLTAVRGAAQALDDALELGPASLDALGEDEFGEMVSLSRPRPPFSESPGPIGSPLDSVSQTDTPSDVPPSLMSRNGSKGWTPDF